MSHLVFTIWIHLIMKRKLVECLVCKFRLWCHQRQRTTHYFHYVWMLDAALKLPYWADFYYEVKKVLISNSSEYCSIVIWRKKSIKTRGVPWRLHWHFQSSAASTVLWWLCNAMHEKTIKKQQHRHLNEDLPQHNRKSLKPLHATQYQVHFNSL